MATDSKFRRGSVGRVSSNDIHFQCLWLLTLHSSITGIRGIPGDYGDQTCRPALQGATVTNSSQLPAYFLSFLFLIMEIQILDLESRFMWNLIIWHLIWFFFFFKYEFPLHKEHESQLRTLRWSVSNLYFAVSNTHSSLQFNSFPMDLIPLLLHTWMPVIFATISRSKYIIHCLEVFWAFLLSGIKSKSLVNSIRSYLQS